ncbi:hypothetical protein C8R47DRAFT_1079678 [Mycena vitilis]|nr:hypothetical protein C8R47DRAFT_1079678 [Mycena vitilis]
MAGRVGFARGWLGPLTKSCSYGWPVVAAWLVRHGILTLGPTIKYLEAFARSRRNMQANVTDLNSVGWAEEPRNAKQAMAVDVASIPSWEVLSRSGSLAATVHADRPLQTNPVPGPPAPPSNDGGIESSTHAPRMEVDGEAAGAFVSSTSGITIITEPVPTALPRPLSPPSPPGSEEASPGDMVGDEPPVKTVGFRVLEHLLAGM